MKNDVTGRPPPPSRALQSDADSSEPRTLLYCFEFEVAEAPSPGRQFERARSMALATLAARKSGSEVITGSRP